MRVHIEGMGVYGSLLIECLEKAYGQHELEITWYDPNSDVNAWRASTGAIYPGGSKKFGDDQEAYKAWEYWYATFLHHPHVEKCNYWFNHKRPPHKGDYEIQRKSPDGLNMGELPSYHVNAQTLVTDTRELHLDKRVQENPDVNSVDVYIVAHSFSHRISHVYWGWTALVELAYNNSYEHTSYRSERNRPCFYFREGRFVMAYAYPVPNSSLGENLWYAGSSIIKQKLGKEKRLSIEPKYAKWKENFQRLGNGGVSVIGQPKCFIEGWRPAPAEGDVGVKVSGGKYYLQPMWNGGIRHFPIQILNLSKLEGLEKLGEIL